MNHRELERLTQGMADGQLSAKEISLLEQELLSHPDSRDFYRRSMRVELLLEEALQTHVPSASREGSTGNVDRRPYKAKRRFSAFAVAATVVMVFALMFYGTFLWQTDSDAQIQVAFSPGASWSGPVSKEGTIAVGETVKIAFGVAEFLFPDDVRAVIEGPAEIGCSSAALLELREGSGWFQVGEAGHGFRVRTPSVDVVDHGTEFGLLAQPNAPDEVHVFSGRVSSAARFAMKEVQELQAGRALQVSPAGRWIELEPDEQRFLKHLPLQVPGMRFSFDGENPLKPEGAFSAGAALNVRTRSGSPAKLVAGVKGKALSVGAVGDIVRTDWPGIGGAAPRTIACWIRPGHERDIWYSCIVSWGDPGRGRCQMMMAKGDKNGDHVLRFALGDTIRFSGRTPIERGKWQHLAVVFRGTGAIDDGDRVELYLNGKRERLDPKYTRRPKRAEVINTVIDSPNAQPMQIGCGPYKTGKLASFFGDIDEVWILPRAVSEREVKGLMGITKNGFYVGAE